MIKNSKRNFIIFLVIEKLLHEYFFDSIVRSFILFIAVNLYIVIDR